MATTTLIDNKAAFPDQTTIEPLQAIPEALVLTQTTVSGTVQGDQPSVRIAYVDQDPDPEVVAEGGDIDAKDPKLSELVVNTQKVGIITVVSNEAYSYTNATRLLGNSLSRAIASKANRLFLQNAAPAEGQTGITGLANYPGIIDGGTITDRLTPLIDAIATIATNGGTPTAILAGYDAWAWLLKLAYADGTPQISPDVANSPTPQLYGLPIVLNAQMPANTLIVIDRTQIVSAAGNVVTAVSSERYFEKDSVGLRVTFRFGYGILRPNRIAKLTTGTAATATTTK